MVENRLLVRGIWCTAGNHYAGFWQKHGATDGMTRFLARKLLLGCPRNGCKWLVNGLKPTYKWGIPWGYNPTDPITIDPITSNGTSK